MLSGCGTTEHDLSPEQFHPFLWQGYCEYPLHYFRGSKRNWDLSLGGVCLNFTGIKAFRLPISVVGQAFRGYEIEVKTPITINLNLVRRD